MKKEFLGAGLAVLVSVSPGAAANVCLRTSDIVSTDSRDGKTLTFKMRDGRTMVNHLQGSCPDLKFNGFAWVVRGGVEEVCEFQQSLRVLQSGQVCLLGKFDQPISRPAAPR